MRQSLKILANSFGNKNAKMIARQKAKRRELLLQMPKIKPPKTTSAKSKDAHPTVITVATPFGFRSFTLGRAKKRVLISFAAFAILFLVFGSAGLFFSFSNNIILQSLLDKTKQNYVELATQNQGLKSIVEEGRAEKEKVAQLKNIINVRSDALATEKLDLTSISVEQKTMLLKNIPNGSPVLYQGITSDYGSRNHPVLGRSIFHEGMDLKAAIGTKVYSSADGIIELTRYNGGYGNMLVVSHSYGFKSVYGHLSRFAVQPGEFVKKGQLIAFSGNTGMTAGPHLHYEVRFMGEPMNPEPFLKWNYGNFAYLFDREKKVRWASLVEATRWQTTAERLSYLQAQKSSVN